MFNAQSLMLLPILSSDPSISIDDHFVRYPVINDFDEDTDEDEIVIDVTVDSGEMYLFTLGELHSATYCEKSNNWEIGSETVSFFSVEAVRPVLQHAQEAIFGLMAEPGSELSMKTTRSVEFKFTGHKYLEYKEVASIPGNITDSMLEKLMIDLNAGIPISAFSESIESWMSGGGELNPAKEV